VSLSLEEHASNPVDMQNPRQRQSRRTGTDDTDSRHRLNTVQNLYRPYIGCYAITRQEKSPESIPDVLQRIGRAGRLFTRWADTRLERFGFSLAQLPVVFALRDRASKTQKDLARLAHIEQPTMAQLLARMERDGLVQRSLNPRDNRSSLVSLTPQAAKQAIKSRAVLIEASKLALEGLSAAEIELLNELLLRVMDNLERAVTADPLRQTRI
jgi:DNA-binding MarR family transcriptional regulator